MLRVVRWVLLLLVLAVLIWGYFFLAAAGVFLSIEPKALANCKAVTGGGVVGIEDLTIDRESKMAILSGYDRWTNLANERAKSEGGTLQPVRGGLWTLDLNEPSAEPIDATPEAVKDRIWPHGISLYRGADGRKTLFVINHFGGKHSVEIFDVNGASLTHRGQVAGDALVSPSDVVGVGESAFYVSNDHGNASGWMRTVEDFGQLRLSSVHYYDGQRFQLVLSRIGGANGINVSADSRSLYLSAASERSVHVYDRDLATNALTSRAKIQIAGFPDNIELLPSGDLLLGVHSKIFDLLAHRDDPTKPSPSHVVHLKADGQGGFLTKTIYYNAGDEISGASVAAADSSRVLIGAIFEGKILDCQWDSQN